MVQYSLYPVSFNSLLEVATTQLDLIQTFPDALEDGLKTNMLPVLCKRN